MSILRFLKSIGRVAQATAPVAVALSAPEFLPVVDVTLRAVGIAEDRFGRGSGPRKAQFASYLVETATPTLIAELKRITGKQVADEVLLRRGLAEVREGVVKCLNAFTLLGKEA
jgi:hypothetical protein